MNLRIPIQDSTLGFMLAEYETLRDLRASLVSQGESRVNFLLATISGAVVALALVNQGAYSKDIVITINAMILVGLFLLGLITYLRLVHRGIAITVYTRGINRIRRYFVERVPDIGDYLILPTSDDVPSLRYGGFFSRGLGSVGLAGMVAIIDSIISVASVVLGLKIIFDQPIGIVLFAGLIAFAKTYLGHYVFHIVLLRKANKETQVRFPMLKEAQN